MQFFKADPNLWFKTSINVMPELLTLVIQQKNVSYLIN